MTTGEVTGHVLPSQKGGVSGLDLVALPSGTMLVALGNNDGVLGRWRTDGGGPIQRVVAPGKDIVSDLVDGKTLLVGTPNGKPIPFSYDYSFWDLATGAAVPAFLPSSTPTRTGTGCTGCSTTSRSALTT